MVIMSSLLIPAMVIRFYQGWFQMLLIDVPLFMASSVLHLLLLPCLARRSSIRKTWLKTFLYLPFLMALGIGLTVTNTNAVMEALFGIKSAFKRTPKYRVAQEGREVAGSEVSQTSGLSFRGSSWSSAATSLLTISYAVTNENYFTAPFLFLFVIGYWYTGLMSACCRDASSAGAPAQTWRSLRRSPSR